MKHLTGKEHSDIARVLLGLIIDMKLPNSHLPAPLVRATRALLDFLYFAQYPVHSSESLVQLQDALQRFYDNKHIFVNLGIREGWELPKLHFAKHYIALIKALGTTDNYNTEYTERLHIDFAKDAYEATNHKDELSQMTIWLERKEKIARHKARIHWRLVGCPTRIKRQPLFPPPPPRIKMTKRPSRKAVPLTEIATEYKAPFFVDALTRFVMQDTDLALTRTQVEDRASNIDLPMRSLPIFHKAQFWLGDTNQHRLMSKERNVVHAARSRVGKHGKMVSARFNTVLVNGGMGGYTSMTGRSIEPYV